MENVKLKVKNTYKKSSYTINWFIIQYLNFKTCLTHLELI